MSFKRYGGGFQFKGGGNTYWSLTGLIIMVGGALGTLFTGNAAIIVLGMVIGFFVAGIATLIPGNSVSDNAREELRQEYIEKADIAFREGNKKLSLEYTRKADRLKST